MHESDPHQDPGGEPSESSGGELQQLQPVHGRRGFLGALALAPLVPLASACRAHGAAAPAAVGSPASASAAEDPYRVLREQPLTDGAEPALSFRALAPRGSAR